MRDLDRFEELFVGGSQAYGRYRAKPKFVKTIKKPVPLAAYKEHLAGGMGLGLVPWRADGTCRFAAIDVDDDNIKHEDLLKKVRDRNMPLHVCRSKSGGAHLYLFMKEPGLPATQVSALLKKWAACLGLPADTEIFPKQDAKKTPYGNWINLPYFGDAKTTRYAVGERGSLSLKQFLESIEWYDP